MGYYKKLIKVACDKSQVFQPSGLGAGVVTTLITTIVIGKATESPWIEAAFWGLVSGVALLLVWIAVAMIIHAPIMYAEAHNNLLASQTEAESLRTQLVAAEAHNPKALESLRLQRAEERDAVEQLEHESRVEKLNQIAADWQERWRDGWQLKSHKKEPLECDELGVPFVFYRYRLAKANEYWEPKDVRIKQRLQLLRLDPNLPKPISAEDKAERDFWKEQERRLSVLAMYAQVWRPDFELGLFGLGQGPRDIERDRDGIPYLWYLQMLKRSGEYWDPREVHRVRDYGRYGKREA